MEQKGLTYSLRVVFDKEENDLFNRLDTWYLKRDGNEYSLVYPHSDTLIDIFSNIQNNDPLKSEFISLLKKEILESKDVRVIGSHDFYIGTAALALFTIVRLGFVDEAIGVIKTRYKGNSIIVAFLYGLLMDKNKYFDLIQLTDILEIIKQSPVDGDAIETKKTVISKIIEERYKTLKKNIKGVNLEINQDKKAVTEKIAYLNFDEKYNDLLNEIDEFINTETSNIVNAGMISNLRVFLQDLLGDIAKRISAFKKEEIPKIEGCKEMGNIRHYLKERLNLSDNDHKFINAFVDILHSEGGHSFTANKEYFRLAKNIAVEVALLILSKYEKVIK